MRYLHFFAIVLTKKLLFYGAAGVAVGLPMFFWWMPCYASMIYDSGYTTISGAQLTGGSGTYANQRVGQQFSPGVSGTATSTEIYYHSDGNLTGTCFFSVYDTAATSTLLARTEKKTCPNYAAGTNIWLSWAFKSTSTPVFYAGHQYVVVFDRYPLSDTGRPAWNYEADSTTFNDVMIYRPLQWGGDHWYGEGTVKTHLHVWGTPPGGGGTGYEGQPTTYSHFFNLWPANGTVVTTTVVELSAQYYYDCTTTYPFERFGFELYEKSRSYTYTYYLASTTPAMCGFGSISQTVNLTATTSYAFRGVFYSPTAVLWVRSSQNEFYVLDNPYPGILGTFEDSTVNLATSTCSITNLSGCVQNALVFAFYPSDDSIAALTSIYDEVKYKPPFGYFNILSAQLGTMKATGTAAFWLGVGTTTITSIFTPLKAGLAWILWVAFALWCLKRLSKLVL